MDAENHVRLSGKISRKIPLKYTPTGIPIAELVVAAAQKFLDRSSVGYFDVILIGDLAENATGYRIGHQVEVEGTLWSRSFKDRRGNKVQETKIIARLIVIVRGEKNG